MNAQCLQVVNFDRKLNSDQQGGAWAEDSEEINLADF